MTVSAEVGNSDGILLQGGDSGSRRAHPRPIGFYDYKNKKNSDLYVTGDLAGAGTQYNQDIDSTLNSLGATLNMMPREDVNTSISLYWMQNDLQNYFLTTQQTRQIQNPAVVYINNGLTNYVVDSYVLTLAADWKTNEKLKLSGSYTYTQNTGDTASGDVLLALQTATGTIDSRIDNTLHSLALGADYTLSPQTKLHASYFYDYYDDSTYDLLTGGVNTLTLGLSYAFKSTARGRDRPLVATTPSLAAGSGYPH